MDAWRRLRAALAGRYEVDREIGRGGSAVVLLARDLKHDRLVAIKVLRPELSASLATERFLREIRIASQLQHPNILPLHDSGSDGALLWYVMPYVAGLTLRQRLTQEKHLPLDEALQIAFAVGGALSHAHERGIVHRDIKPENILLSGGQATVADFGVARAITEAGGSRLTSSGLVIGTPAYMSPEQADSKGDVDERSDQYALACVLHEMLAGEPPFTGPTPQAVIAKQLGMPVPSVRVVRESVPESVADVIRRALTKIPADRFATVEKFTNALKAAAQDTSSRISFVPRRGRVTIALVALALVTLVAWVSGQLSGRGWAFAGEPGDSTLYVILPLEYDAGVDERFDDEQLMHDALTYWDGIRVADAFEVREASARIRGSMTQAQAAGIARKLGAGRFIRGMIASAGDSLRVSVSLYDASGTGQVLSNRADRLERQGGEVQLIFTNLLDGLLLNGLISDQANMREGTRSLPARRAFARGQQAIEAWDLARADAAFTEATIHDPAYPQPNLGLALVRSWNGAAVPTWNVLAEQAELERDRLSPREGQILTAMLARTKREMGVACAVWQDLTEQFPDDFNAWYGLGDCRMSDNAVVPDRRGLNGWSFRSSHHQATRAFQRAYEINPAILAAFRFTSYESLPILRYATGNVLRSGSAIPPDTTTFYAEPRWQGDSLGFVPYKRSTGRSGPASATWGEAVRQQRLIFHRVAVTWSTMFPQDPSAIEALAIALAQLGEEPALATLGRARALARDPRDQLRLAGTEVWMQLAFGLPTRADRISRVRFLADSLLDNTSSDADPWLLAGLASLTGRAALAARYMQHPDVIGRIDIPAPLAESAGPLLIYAALGAPVDSLMDVVQRSINQSPQPGSRKTWEMQWLARAAMLAFPRNHGINVASLEGRGNPLIDILGALQTGDTATVSRALADRAAQSRRVFAADRTFDLLYLETALLAALGANRQAADGLDSPFAALRQMSQRIVSHPVQVAALVQSMALRAKLAADLSEREAARAFAQSVITLWGDADPVLLSFVRELDPMVAESVRTQNRAERGP